MILFALASSCQTKTNIAGEILHSPIIGGLVFAGAHIACDYFLKKSPVKPKKRNMRPSNLNEFIKNSHRQWKKANRYREGHKQQIYSGGLFCFGQGFNKTLGEMGKNGIKKNTILTMHPEL